MALNSENQLYLVSNVKLFSALLQFSLVIFQQLLIKSISCTHVGQWYFGSQWKSSELYLLSKGWFALPCTVPPPAPHHPHAQGSADSILRSSRQVEAIQ